MQTVQQHAQLDVVADVKMIVEVVVDALIHAQVPVVITVVKHVKVLALAHVKRCVLIPVAHLVAHAQVVAQGHAHRVPVTVCNPAILVA